MLTSTITRAKPDWKIARSHRDGVASMALAADRGAGADRVAPQGRLPIHAGGRCSQAQGPVDEGRARTEIELLDGGAAPVSDPCEAKSQHGYFGIEAQAVDTIARFIKANLQ